MKVTDFDLTKYGWRRDLVAAAPMSKCETKYKLFIGTFDEKFT
jgi:hypothetical protein